MGFRGEALAALASISKLEIRTSDGNESCRIVLEAGDVPHVEMIARNRGTTIEAKALFFNTPARLKFQKSATASAASVLKIVQTLSLAHPEVRFTLQSNGKITLQCHQTDWKHRAEELLGEFAHEVEAPMIRGLLRKPQEGKSNRSGQTLFINRRPIFSPLIAKAVKDGFGTRMQESLFPQFLLFLELPSDWVDINVHPQKREVRFRDEGRIYQIVRNAVFQAFEGAPEEPRVSLPWESPPLSFTQIAPTNISEETRHFAEKQALDFTRSMQMAPTFQVEDAPQHLDLEPTSMPLALLGDFLLVQIEQEWQLVDLRGAEARIIFEEMERPSSKMQALLWPLEYKYSNPEELVQLLQTAQIEARVTGKQMVAIDATPQNLKPTHVLEFLEQLISPGKEQRRIAAALTKTCRSTKRRYSLTEASCIWEKLCQCKDKMYDPLGRKILSSITKETLTGMFG
jgi:DNA mismatch repair protein MutL